MTPLLRKLLGMNWLLIVVMLALAVFGVVAIYSCTYMRESAAYSQMWRSQSVWIGLGMIVFLVVSLTDYRWVRWGALPIYLGSVVFLVLTLLIGVKIENARRWLKLGGLQFQPSQLAIIAGILILALLLTQFRKMHPMLKLAACGLLSGAPALLILKQPDFGSTLIWLPVVFSMLFVSRIPLRYLIVLVLLGLAVMPLVYNFVMKDYQKTRITAWLYPDVNPQKDAWAINQSLIAIGSGGWAGKGFKAPNTQVELGYIPQTTVPNDYIFVPIGEQWGFIGGATLVGAFALLLSTILFVAFRAGDELGTLLATGVAALIFIYTFQNIGMTILIMPVTGVPLPLISYSGSFVLVIMFALALVNSVWVHRRKLVL